VNGTTAGIQAAVLSACGPGDTLIAARNCHLSAVSAMALAGAPAGSLLCGVAVLLTP
jgi:arginine decarboxylase